MAKIITVNFRGDNLYGIENEKGVYVALKPVVEAMGLDWSSQHKRVQRDPILSEGMVIMTIPFGRGGAQEAVCLKLDLVNGWLFTIDTGRIRDAAVRSRVQTYQRECYSVLFEHFYGKPRLELGAQAHEPETLKLRLVTEARHTFGLRAAGQLWTKLELPIVPAMFDGSGQPDLFDWPKTIDHAPSIAA